MQSPLLPVVSVSTYELGFGFVNSLGFAVVSLTPLTPAMFPCPLSQDSPMSAHGLAVGICICLHQFLSEATLTTVGLGTNV